MKKTMAFSVVLLVLLGISCTVQADLKSMAKLFLCDLDNSSNWVEGYAKSVSGNGLNQNSLRKNNHPALITRTTTGADAIVWQTAIVPPDLKSPTVTFFWEAGEGCNMGEKQFSLTVNGSHEIKFRILMGKKFWNVTGPGQSELEFYAVKEDGYKDLFGYMKLTVPASWVTPGKPVELKLIGEAAKSNVWVMTFKDPKALEYLKGIQRNGVYYVSKFDDDGTLLLELATTINKAGEMVSIQAGNKTIAKGKLKASDSLLSLLSLSVPPTTLNTLKGNVKIVLDGKSAGTLDWSVFKTRQMKKFLEEKLHSDSFIFSIGTLPKIEWRRPLMVERLLGGSAKLKVTYYDAKMNPVKEALKPGRYAAVVESKAPDGYAIRRYVTLYCIPKKWSTWRDKIDLTCPPFAKLNISPDVWKAHQSYVDDHLSSFLLHTMCESDFAATFWAGLSELSADSKGPKYKNNPMNMDRQWWVTFKRKQFGVTDKYPSLARPVKIDSQKATALHKGDPASVGFTADDLENIRQVCRDWAKESKIPLATLVAHKGVIVFHEAFGTLEDGKKMTVNTRTWMASITKAMTGTLMMEFVDQGLIDLDDPVKKYLPELDVPVETVLTIRHLFTHTNGFWGHGTWGADWSSSLENVIGQYLPYLKVGKAHSYNGLGYALAGKVIERVSGRCIPYLFQERLFGPLGASHTKIEGTAGDARSTCLDIAKVAQMLANRGSYGNLQFFSEQTFKKMLPISLGKMVPESQTEWGIGVVWMNEKNLDKKSFGHDAGSGAIFRIDPVNDLVIVSCRNTPGPKYDKFHKKLFDACTAPLARGKKTKNE